MEPELGKDHRHFRSRMDAIVQSMFEINYSQLIQYGETGDIHIIFNISSLDGAVC